MNSVICGAKVKIIALPTYILCQAFISRKLSKAPESSLIRSALPSDVKRGRIMTYTLSPALKSIESSLLVFAVFLFPKSLFYIGFRLTYNYNRKSKFCEFRCPMKLGCRFFKKIGRFTLQRMSGKMSKGILQSCNNSDEKQTLFVNRQELLLRSPQCFCQLACSSAAWLSLAFCQTAVSCI